MSKEQFTQHLLDNRSIIANAISKISFVARGKAIEERNGQTRWNNTRADFIYYELDNLGHIDINKIKPKTISTIIGYANELNCTEAAATLQQFLSQYKARGV